MPGTMNTAMDRATVPALRELNNLTRHYTHTIPPKHVHLRSSTVMSTLTEKHSVTGLDTAGSVRKGVSEELIFNQRLKDKG